ncbi:MAG TPA: sigma-54 dependent transcriptional regulator [Kofleriaceae bacterium]|jgi:DNA-binding NtrC family response regulator|nr:sigma-54 dependent transcriptional regulator [Kofleriaceae bacterium]
MRSILLAGDQPHDRARLTGALEKCGFRVIQAASGRTALAIARRETLHGMVLDLDLRDMAGIAVLDGVLRQAPGLPAVIVTGRTGLDAAVEAVRRGAADVVGKPIDVDALVARLRRHVTRAGQVGAVPTPASESVAAMEELGMIGHSRALRELFDLVKRVAPYHSTVLISGESGTGKELIARALHRLGPRRDGPFVPINCATLAEPILESELFGHERGAFTSADRAKEGVMESADGGTLFLDEVHEMGPAVQAKLLRALERREFRRVGGTRKISVDVNVIAACNQDLEQYVGAGRFREDLYYRLKVVAVTVPPLRERGEAIPVLARRFLDDLAGHIGLPPKRLSADALAALQRHRWPGNIRELRNCMESLTLMVPRAVIQVDDLPAAVRGAPTPEIRLRVGMRMDEVEREVIRRNLEFHGTVKDAAQALGVGLRTLHDKVARYGLRRPR